MSATVERSTDVRGSDEVEISPAAIAAYGRLLGALARRIHTHAAPDGGLICEDRTCRARPTLWRIGGDGEIIPDQPYSYTRAGFVPGRLPHGLS